MTEYSIYEIWQGGMRVASCCGPDETARKEAEHYAMVYGQDGPVEMKKRRQRDPQVPNGTREGEAT